MIDGDLGDLSQAEREKVEPRSAVTTVLQFWTPTFGLSIGQSARLFVCVCEKKKNENQRYPGSSQGRNQIGNAQSQPGSQIPIFQ